ncbi:hypothetical protein ACPOL_5356 [Acidisarcina polymorpha]|uniref:Uncharacterized protein n=1 Tax=Acidisarcina polymorpha TaxID=2211140 RepID=A0A2Z5G7C5_9BACT|nr:hypothetical protein [Acidisarcina polymorpha]AXC14604.1 hypothetical protein ACPOL_5356 [Acidisarcina polymorpha]
MVEEKAEQPNESSKYAPEDRSAEAGEMSKDNIESGAFSDADKLKKGQSRENK